jgi:sugar phosphate isomerase/epimerase
MKIGLDNYGLLPLGLTPLDTLRWAAGHGADGVAFSGLAPEHRDALDRYALADLKAFADEHGLYLEWGGGQHVPRDMTTWARRDLTAINRRAAVQAATLGVRVVRSCSGGLMRWNPDAPPTVALLEDMAASLREQRAMLTDLGVVLAIETHFEFTSFELLRVFRMCEAEPGGWLGICLDTMNLLTMLEDPVSATRRLLPWVVSTHVKDGGVRLDATGLATFTAPIGQGIVDLDAIVGLLATLPRPVHLSIEDHGGSFHLPIFDPAFLAEFPDLTAADLARLVGWSQRAAAGPLPREQWPGVCEARLVADLDSLRSLVDRAGRRPVDARLEPQA